MTSSLRLRPGKIEVLLMLSLSILFTASNFSKASTDSSQTEASQKIDLFKWSESSPPILGPSAKYLSEKTGLAIKGIYRGYFYANLDGGKTRGAAWDQDVRLEATYDFGFLTQTLKGLTLTGQIRDREGQDPNGLVGATSAFQPSNIESGKYLRFRYLYLSYITPELFGAKDFLTLSGGWQSPYEIFVQQPLSKLFVNNMFESAKGIGANIPWTSSYSAWGGYLKIKPKDWLYFQAGLYMAIPEETVNQNHGWDFQGSRIPGKPNGLFAIAEAGLTPKLGPDHLPGKYVFGTYWFGVHNASWNGTEEAGQYGFYWQIDQQLYRAPASIFGSSSSTNDEPSTDQSEKGLHFFSILSYAPPYNNTLTFYFHTGLVYEGLIPTRDHDRLGIIYGEGFYSNQLAASKQAHHLREPDNQSVLEIDYNVAIARWLNFKPFYQFFINPASDHSISNASILGFEIYATF
ncbi:MAG: hypothetical protein C5B47_04500 [Verrucomicrobia bacterium]|nr:MAG: hypothetical protein C5B47_04500 [Verrucomicrobiota bacterium]